MMYRIVVDQSQKTSMIFMKELPMRADRWAMKIMKVNEEVGGMNIVHVDLMVTAAERTVAAPSGIATAAVVDSRR